MVEEPADDDVLVLDKAESTFAQKALKFPSIVHRRSMYMRRVEEETRGTTSYEKETEMDVR